jgi:XRE family transcriptional regulator, aerobic/anaerobic benzoate catabolism transcriptional regulator
MKRVIDQGDLRPTQGESEAMDDLRRILASRSDFYALADISYETSGRTMVERYMGLRHIITASTKGGTKQPPT